MFFLNSMWLWGSLAAIGVAVPIIIHLMSRYRARPIEWAAMALLRRAMVVRSRRLRLEDLILLILRCLAAGAIALALARPALTPSGAGGLGGSGGSAKAGVVIALDGSFSMAHKPGVRSRFDLARERARDVLATISPGDPVTLVEMGSRPRILMRNVAYDAARVEAVLKSAEPFAEGLNLEVCLDEMRQLINEIKAPSRECYIITDCQTVTWDGVSDKVKSLLKELRTSGTVFLVPIGADNSENLAITRLSIASGVLRKGSLARYTADIRNAGSRPCSDVTVNLVVDDVPVDQRLVDKIGPGETVTVPLFAHFERTGVFTVGARLGNDALSVDNARFVVADVRESVNVLCVNGDPSDEPFRGETDFLAAALRPEGGSGLSAVNVETVPLDSFRISVLPSYDVVILANVPELIREHAFALAEFVRRGGGLFIFLGNKTTAGAMNSRMRDAQGVSFLPAEILEAKGDLSDESADQGDGPAKKERGWRLSTKVPEHPVTGIFGAMPADQWSSIRFKRYFSVRPVKDARVLLTLEPGDDPILVERPVGRGQVLLFASTADREWTDMVVHPAYLMLVQQAVTFLTRKANEAPMTVGDNLVFDLPLDGVPATVSVRGPNGDMSQVRATDRDGHKAAVLTGAERPGIYSVQWANNAFPLKLAVNVEAVESAVAVLRGQALSAAAAKLPVRLVAEGQDMRDAVRESRFGRELWRTLLMLALIALVVEAILGRLFGRRITRATAATGDRSI